MRTRSGAAHRWSASDMFALAVWTGWVATAAFAEVWIRMTRGA